MICPGFLFVLGIVCLLSALLVFVLLQSSDMVLKTRDGGTTRIGLQDERPWGRTRDSSPGLCLQAIKCVLTKVFDMRALCVLQVMG